MRIKQIAAVWLRRGERITGTDNVYLAKNGSILFLTNFINTLNGFILYILIAKFLPPEIYGEYKYFLSIFGILSIFSFTGMDNALMRAVAKGHDQSLHAAFRRKFFGSAIGSFICLIIAAIFFLNDSHRLSIALILIAFFSPIIQASTVYGSFFSGKKQFSIYGKINIGIGVLYFLGMSISFVFFQDSLIILAIFLLISSCSFFAYIYAITKKSSNTIDEGMLRLGSHLSALDILGVIATRIDGILIFHFLGPTSLAVYTMATVPVEQLKGFAKISHGLAMPKFATADALLLKNTISRKIFLFSITIALGVIVYILLAPAFYNLFFKKYPDSITYSQVYSISLIFVAPASLILSLFIARGLKKEISLFNAINYTLQLVLIFFLGWLFGLWGIIFARLSSRIIMLFSSVILLNRSKLSYFDKNQ
jgi:O-antigen/teichoic acid export membrane protein